MLLFTASLILLGVVPFRSGSLVLALQTAMFGLFIIAMIYSALLFSKSRTQSGSKERKLRLWNMVLFALTLGLFFSTVGILLVRSDLWQLHQALFTYLGILSRSLPLCFFFVGTYYHDRFAFFDVFIKRGTYFFLLLLFLLAYFAFVNPLLDRSEIGWLRPWVLALTLSPLLLLLPFNPHFLFNALNAIAGLIQKEPARAEETVEELAEVFRYTLKRSEKELVRLEEELDFVRAYLDVEKARFGDRLLVQLDVDDDAKGEMIPTMAIQTLVENAVKHGVAAIRGIGIVEIRAKRQGDRLCLEVLDNGPGPVSAPPADEPSRDGSDYGLRNLASRLKAHYGPLGLLSIRRDPAGKITVASLTLPISAAKPA